MRFFKRSRAEFRVSWRLRTLVLLFVGLSLVPAYLRAYSIHGASEIPTVLVGDQIIVNKAAYTLRLPYSNVNLFRIGSPHRGDFVFLRLPSQPQLRPGFFKRVIGLPGETLEIRENQVIIDGRALPVRDLDPADFAWVPAAHPIGSVVQSEDGHWITFTPGKSQYRNHPRVRLGDDEYFLLGDNRDDSLDSRAFGPVARDLLLGKVIATLPMAQRTTSAHPDDKSSRRDP
jgi:signal peptidase I